MPKRLRRSRKSLHVALVYNADAGIAPDTPEDRGSTAELRRMIHDMARVLMSLGHRVTILPLANDLSVFQRRLRRLVPDVIFNQSVGWVACLPMLIPHSISLGATPFGSYLMKMRTQVLAFSTK